MKKVTIIGCGMVGKTIAIELSKTYEVTACDAHIETALYFKQHNINFKNIDATKKTDLQKVVNNADLVVLAVPGFLGFNVLSLLLELTSKIVDISFFPENALLLQQKAQKNKVVAAVDCGIAPGFSSMVAGFHYNKMKIEKYLCMVGGLPVVRQKPFEYKAPFSPIDVIEEYTRPARIKRNNKILEVKPLTEIEKLHFENLPELQCFLSDGLRTMIDTLPNIPNMEEKTIRYPGHAEMMQLFTDVGLFSTNKINVGKKAIKPIDFTSTLFIKQWKLNPNEKEFTVMQCKVEGTENGQNITYTYWVYDEWHKETGFSSMSRTTGYTCCAVVEYLLQNQLKPGIYTPEVLAMENNLFKHVCQFLTKKGIEIKISKK